MTEAEYKDKLNKFISDIETVRDGHKMDALLCNEKTDLAKRSKDFHTNKAAAYDFVIRKLRRTFNIVNDDKETST